MSLIEQMSWAKQSKTCMNQMVVLNSGAPTQDQMFVPDSSCPGRLGLVPSKMFVRDKHSKARLIPVHALIPTRQSRMPSGAARQNVCPGQTSQSPSYLRSCAEVCPPVPIRDAKCFLSSIPTGLIEDVVPKSGAPSPCWRSP